MATFNETALGMNTISLNPNKKVFDEIKNDDNGRFWIKWTGKKRFVLLDHEMAMWVIHATACR